MRDFIQDFPNHIDIAIEIAESISLNSDYKNIDNIIISGQGGSAMGAMIVKNLLHELVSVPIIINQDYNLPSFVNERTLFIASSYSGNTEETLCALKNAEDKKSIIFSICSGGELLAISKQKKHDYIILPSGGAPRAMLCYSLVQILFVIARVKQIPINNLKQHLIASKDSLLDQQADIISRARKIASTISDKMPFIYAYPEFEGVALRFKQQLNENSKRHACYNIIPEMNHNEIVPWVKKHMCVMPIFLNGKSSIRNKKRMEVSINEINKSVDQVIELNLSDSMTYFNQYFYFIHLVDWISIFIAEQDGVNPNDIDLINSLKGQLKNM